MKLTGTGLVAKQAGGEAGRHRPCSKNRPAGELTGTGLVAKTGRQMKLTGTGLVVKTGRQVKLAGTGLVAKQAGR